MSKRRNGTNRVATALGINPYGWGTGKARKRPREVRTPVGQIKNNLLLDYNKENGGMQDGRK